MRTKENPVKHNRPATPITEWRRWNRRRWTHIGKFSKQNKTNRNLFANERENLNIRDAWRNVRKIHFPDAKTTATRAAWHGKLNNQYFCVGVCDSQTRTTLYSRDFSVSHSKMLLLHLKKACELNNYLYKYWFIKKTTVRCSNALVLLQLHIHFT